MISIPTANGAGLTYDLTLSVNDTTNITQNIDTLLFGGVNYQSDIVRVDSNSFVVVFGALTPYRSVKDCSYCVCVAARLVMVSRVFHGTTIRADELT